MPAAQTKPREVQSKVKKLPVIVIPGYLAPREIMFFIKDYLYEEGFPVHDVDLGWSTERVPELAEKLKKRVNEILRKTGSRKLNLVGVSLGGITGLYYIKKLGGDKVVNTFVAVGTPFQGHWLSYLGILFMPDVSAPLHDLTPNSDIIKDVRNSTYPKNVRIVSISSTHDFVAPPRMAHLKGAKNVILNVEFTPLTHQYLLFSQEVFERVKQELLK